MTDHYINAEICRTCIVKRTCCALVPDGGWNPYKETAGGACRALVQPGK